ncbi:RNA methyltransferase [Thalassobaculum sp. OXR-137]|uniref:RNA methyltransferase n=1 Tax=Thalassobaculum sp. OXR-137 TaxID=3100173 RepID=UPI002AC926F4|nr:RNA methyltransferase [Thalassobaculum sp. OXR-137]WPZ36126.1 RNA methyltransferase [Thalassobaculum sp. OXR-137]
MRGYFGIGADRINKAQNMGALMRTAHAFGASFVFTVGETYNSRELRHADTSGTTGNLPYYRFGSPDEMLLPQGCALVGVEITDDAIELPSFHHPKNAAYIMGPERGHLDPELVERCEHVIKIPTRFSVNVSLAGGIVMYDRMLCLGLFAPRPHRPGAPTEPAPVPAFGAPLWVRKQRRRDRKAEEARLKDAKTDRGEV